MPGIYSLCAVELFFLSALYYGNSCLIRLKFRKPDQNKPIHQVQFIKYENIMKEEADYRCKVSLVCLFFRLDTICETKCICFAEQGIFFFRKKKSILRFKHLQPAKLNCYRYYCIMPPLNLLLYLIHMATRKMARTSWKFPVLLVLVLHHPISSLSWFWRAANQPQCQDQTTPVFFSIYDHQYVRLRRHGVINFFCVLLRRVVTLTDPDHAASNHHSWSAFRGAGLCFVLSRNVLEDVSSKVKQK